MGPTQTPATETPAKTHSRVMHLQSCDLAAGDAIDVADTPGEHYWRIITSVDTIKCADDTEEDGKDDPCEGTCVAVLTFEPEDGFYNTQHIQPYESYSIPTRVAAAVTAADMLAESEAQAAAAYERYRAEVAAAKAEGDE